MASTGIQRPPTDSSGFALSSTHWLCTFYNYLSAPPNTTPPFITQYQIYDPFSVMDATNNYYVGALRPYGSRRWLRRQHYQSVIGTAVNLGPQ